MKDVELAKQILNNESQCLVVVKDQTVLFKSKDRGIKPLYLAVTKLGDELSGASMADRVIGKAAAMLCVYSGICEMHTLLVSKPAQEVLKNARIHYEYEQLIEFILNRDKTGMCPVETRAQYVSDPEKMMHIIKEFLESIGAL